MKDQIQEQLVIARKNQILDSAARVFAEKGFHPSTIKDIAKDAGIADGTIYIYFKNKHELLIGIFDRMRATILEAAPTEMPSTPDLKAFLKMMLSQPLRQLKADNFELFRVIVSELLVNDDLRTLYYRQILQPTLVLAEQELEVLAAQGFVNGEHIALTVRAISGMLMGLMLENIMGDPLLEAQWDELPEFLSQLLLKGLDTK